MKKKYLAFAGIIFFILTGLLQSENETDHNHETSCKGHQENKCHSDKNEDQNERSAFHLDENTNHSHEEELHHEDDIIEMSRESQREAGLTLAVAGPGSIESMCSFVGEVRLHEDRLVHIYPNVTGIVREVLVSLGDRVDEGQTLAIIESPELAELKADYLEKFQNVELTQGVFQRKQHLKKEDIVSEAEWFEAKLEYEKALTMLRSAKSRLLVLGIKEEEIKSLNTANDFEFASFKLKSPIAGTIIFKHLTRGEKIGEEEVFMVADLSLLWVDLQIPTGDIERIKEGDSVDIVSKEGKKAKCDLILVGPTVNEESRTCLGRAILQNPKGGWKPGMFVRGELYEKSSSKHVVVPSDALQNIDGNHVLFIPQDHGFKAVLVALGRRNKNKVEILSGLNAGDSYVEHGAFELKAIKVTSGANAHAGHGH